MIGASVGRLSPLSGRYVLSYPEPVAAVSKSHLGSDGVLPAWSNLGGSTGLDVGDLIVLVTSRDKNRGANSLNLTFGGTPWNIDHFSSRLTVCWRFREAGDGDYTLNTGATPVTEYASVGVAFRTAGPVGGISAGNEGTETSITVPSLYVPASGCGLLTVTTTAARTGTATMTGPSGWTNLAEVSRWFPTVAAFYKPSAALGDTGPIGSFTVGAFVESGHTLGATLAIPPVLTQEVT